jgi:hypothetical protein
MRYIGEMFTSTYENFNELPSACTSPTTCPPFNLDAIEPRKFPDVFYHDLRFEWDVNKEFNFYVGVENLLDTHPPFGLPARVTPPLTAAQAPRQSTTRLAAGFMPGCVRASDENFRLPLGSERCSGPFFLSADDAGPVLQPHALQRFQYSKGAG